MRLFPLSALALSVFLWTAPVFADAPKPDDTVTFDLYAEGWVTTKTADVTLAVEAAVTGAQTESALRTAMADAAAHIAKADWRMTGFNRTQDPSGLEHWSAVFEARLPEADLAGLRDKAKKMSKPGLQIEVASIAFTPTLDETETTASQLRADAYKKINAQLATLNAALPGRAYRIAQIDFSRLSTASAAPRPMLMAAKAMTNDDLPLERAQKISLHARVVFAALPPAGK